MAVSLGSPVDAGLQRVVAKTPGSRVVKGVSAQVTTVVLDSGVVSRRPGL